MADNSVRRGEYVNPNESIQALASNPDGGKALGEALIQGIPGVTADQGGSSVSFSITPRESAYAQLDQEMIRLFGRKATQEEKTAFYLQLNRAEKQYASRSSANSRTDYAFDKGAFINQYVVGLAKNEIQLGKDLGGTTGQLFRNLKTYADNMGIPSSESGLLETVTKIINGEKDETSVMEDFRKRAMSLYGGLADRLNADPSLTVREAAGDYIELMAKYLDLNPNNISLFDTTLTKGINFMRDGKPALKTMSEFIADLRSDERFQFGTMAHEEARNLGSSIARLMS